jgi:CDP-paratose 2-epimerase
MSRHFLVTGGAGFIGSNYVSRLLKRGEEVTIYDNLSRNGARLNLDWLEETYGPRSFHLVQGDVRDADLIDEVARCADVIVHLAAQVAVTTSVYKPREDFEINALGTFNVLEAARASGRNPAVIYASTNKVYGGMEDTRVVEGPMRYGYADLPFGVSELQPLDFHSPYGCSKGSGDQYMRDYHRIYGLPTVVFRQSCIYGPRQFGVEDQGWVAWFIIAAVTGKALSIYGDGKQVRDILYVEDLLNAYDAALENLNKSAGQVFNVGGGIHNVISVWTDFGLMLEKLFGRKLDIAYGDWRPGDQRVYISNINKIEQELGWTPKMSAEQGIETLYNWVLENRALFEAK